ncbi:dienelactone hydrolase family protein [soil metagenome]|jgi:dienelactone hydrolase
MITEKGKDRVQIPVGQTLLSAELFVPEEAKGLVIFSHGSGSSRLSTRNDYVAEILNQKSFATLLLNLLTPEEDENYEARFDIALLTNRLITVTEWTRKHPAIGHLPVGYLGASTGAAAAMRAAVSLPDLVRAVVSREGRLDLASEVLQAVRAATLLVVGSQDDPVAGYNQDSHELLQGIKDLYLVEGADNLFEKQETLEEVTERAADWFRRYLGKGKLQPLRQDQP